MRGFFNMRFSAIVACALVGMTCTANAALVISGGHTKHVSCESGTCAATAADAVLNDKDLKKLLVAGNVKLVSGSAAQDIVFNAKFKWTKKTRLTLDAYRSIVFALAVTAEGTGAVTLITNDGGKGGDYSFTDKGKLTFWDTASDLVINGVQYKLALDLPSLISAMGTNPSGVFALANGYDASVDGTYPASAYNATFNGTLEGLGHAISNFSVEDYGSGHVGLIADLSATGQVRDLRLVALKLLTSSSYTGGLVGYSVGSLKNISVSGLVYGYLAGGVAGYANGGSLQGLHSSATIYGTSGAGGIAGAIASAPTSNCLFDGSVNSGGAGGGITGSLYGTITDSRSTGTVSGIAFGGQITGAYFLGGIAGYVFKKSTVNASSATGTVAFTFSARNRAHNAHTKYRQSAVGGLVGHSAGTITNSYSTGSVADQMGYQDEPSVGGLVGWQVKGQITASFATGSVSSAYNAGGLVGRNSGAIQQSYAFGAVEGAGSQGYAGGLVGLEEGGVSQSYSTGSVTGQQSDIGGLLGLDSPSSDGNTATYWDLDTSGISNTAQGAGFPANDPGIVGLNDAQLKSGVPAGFDPNVWAQSATINNGYPYLLANPPQ